MSHTFDLGAEGSQLCREGFYIAGEIALSKAVPSPENLYNRANALRRLGRYREAMQVAMRARDVGVNDQILHLLGCLHLDMNDPVGAMGVLDAIKHKFHQWQFSYALACLHAGEWKQGFHHYEARLQEDHSQPLPMWNGEPLDGQILAVRAEQGLGDTILMARFRELLPKNHVWLVPNPLVRLFDACSPNAPFNAWKMVPMMSLPQRLGITELPPFKPYIKVREKFDLPRLPDTLLNVGIVWKSKAGGFLRKRHEIEHGEAKSLPLASVLALAGIPGVKLYSLQHDGDSDIGALGAGPLLQNLGPQIADFADLASFIAEMDVVVTADTGPAHLAGAMGKHTIVMVNQAGSWQWGSGNKSPWYGSNLEIVRQTTTGDWESVIAKVASRLSTLCAMSQAGIFISVLQ